MLQLLWTYLQRQRWRVFALALMIAVTIGLEIINPQIVRRFLDNVENGRPLNSLYRLAGLFIGLSLIRHSIKLVAAYTGEYVSWTATNALREDLALHCLRLDMAFHKRYKPGELIERVDGDVNQLANFFAQLVIRLGTNLVLIVATVGAILWTNWQIGLSVLLLVGIGLLLVRWLNAVVIRRLEKQYEAEANLFGYLEEWLNGTVAIQTNRARPFIMNRLYELLRTRWRSAMNASYASSVVHSMPSTIFGIGYIFVFVIGGRQWLDGGITVGTLYAILFYVDLVRTPLFDMMHQIEDLQKAAAGVVRIKELYEEQASIVDGSRERLTLPQIGCAVRFSDVSFAYADEPDRPILEDLSFDMPGGQVLGLLGRTGSGKSTLIKLVIRLYDPTNGQISIGDGTEMVSLADLKQQVLRRTIGVVTQQVQLFNATVRQNLTLFNAEIPDERIYTVLADIGLDSWLTTLPHGLDSHLAADTALSAGQAQLLAFARVFLTDPRLVILDEASSRLDPATETLIERALDRLLDGRTVIIVAHRLATVQRADQIMILDAGRIAEYGARTQLVNDPKSRFAAMLRAGLTTLDELPEVKR